MPSENRADDIAEVIPVIIQCVIVSVIQKGDKGGMDRSAGNMGDLGYGDMVGTVGPQFC